MMNLIHQCTGSIGKDASTGSPGWLRSGSAKQGIATVIALLIAVVSIAQSPATSFHSHLSASCQGFTQAQIDTFISHSAFENFRLQNQPDTLVFDNGFTVILPSAASLQSGGVIPTAAVYPAALPRHYKMPTFHLNPSGQVTAEYSITSTKYTGQ